MCIRDRIGDDDQMTGHPDGYLSPPDDYRYQVLEIKTTRDANFTSTVNAFERRSFTAGSLPAFYLRQMRRYAAIIETGKIALAEMHDVAYPIIEDLGKPKIGRRIEIDTYSGFIAIMNRDTGEAWLGNIPVSYTHLTLPTIYSV